MFWESPSCSPWTPPLTKEDPRVFHLGPPGVAPAMDVMVRFYPVRTSLLIFLTLNASMSHVLPRAKGRVAVITAEKTAICFRQSGITRHVSPRLNQFFDTELLHVWHQRVPICHPFCFRNPRQRMAAAAMIRFTAPLSVTRPDRATCMLHIRTSPALF